MRAKQSTRGLQYPWIVAQFLKNNIKSEEPEVIDYCNDLYTIRENMRKIGGIKADAIESSFSSPDLPKSVKLKKLIAGIQESHRQGKKGSIFITNDQIVMTEYLKAIAYMWALTTNSSAISAPVTRISRELYKAHTAYDASFSASAEKYRYAAFLVIESFAPLNLKQGSDVSMIPTLLDDRTGRVTDAFTAVIVTVSSEGLASKEDKKIQYIVEDVMGMLQESYGDICANTLRHYFDRFIVPFDEQQQATKIVL